MKRKKQLLSLLIICTCMITSCSYIPTNVDAAFKNFTLTLFQQDVASSTLALHYSVENPEEYGVSSSEITFGTFETDSVAIMASFENCQAVLDKFSYNSLSKENQLTYDILSSYINTSLEGAPYTLYDEPLSPLTGIHAQLPVLLAEYAFHTTDDVETYLQLIETTPAYFSSLIEFEQAKSDAGLFMSDVIVEEIIAQCNAFINMGENNYLLSTFEERLATIEDITASQKADYISQNQTLLESAILPAYQQLVSALSDLKGSGKNDLGLCYLPDGKQYYCYLAERETGSSRSMDDMISLIETQIASDLLALHSVVEENPSITETASSKISSAPDKILSDLEELIIGAFPEPSDVNVTVKYVPSSLEPYLSPAFYLIPAIDNSSENVIYINQGNALEDIDLFTTLAHEGYPGHLYQTTYFASTDPDPLRSLFNFKGYVEGWATYAEMCSYYLSSYEKPYATLLQKNNSLILGLYAMADIGIHYQGWNQERTIQYFKDYGIDHEDVIKEVYELIIGDPANYLSYYVGYVEILDLKQEMIQKDDSFTQKNFHRKFLNIGPAPFDIVREEMLGDVS